MKSICWTLNVSLIYIEHWKVRWHRSLSLQLIEDDVRYGERRDFFDSSMGFSLISGTEILSPHGMPLDLLDRIMIIRTLPYGMEDMIEVIDYQSFHVRLSLLFRSFEYVRKWNISIQLMNPYKYSLKSEMH